MFNDLLSLTQLGTTVSLSVEINIAIHCAVTYYDVMGCRDNYLTSPHDRTFWCFHNCAGPREHFERSQKSVQAKGTVFSCSGPWNSALPSIWPSNYRVGEGQTEFLQLPKILQEFSPFQCHRPGLDQIQPSTCFCTAWEQRMFFAVCCCCCFNGWKKKSKG